jgi:ubiquinone/menaquinone biosynthesis C-methylase UbiE
MVNPQQDWICLDIATGAGHLAHKLAMHSSKVVASDLTQKMLIQAEKLAIEKKIHNMEFEEFDVHNIPHQDNKFDLVS